MKFNSKLRDIIIAALMCITAGYVFLHPPQKQATEAKMHLASFVPDAFGQWQSTTHNTSDYFDEWQSINELLVRTYYNNVKRARVNFFVEYGSDLRRSFAFHYPENCYRASGNEIELMEPLAVELADGRQVMAKCLFIKGVGKALNQDDRYVAYWLTIDSKHYYKTFSIKLNQMLAGILGKSRQGYLIRVDYFDDLKYDKRSIAQARQTISTFIRELYLSLSAQERKVLFGARRD